MTDPVIFLHGITDEELIREYQNADVLVHASTILDYRGGLLPKAELMGNVPLEAMACGLPVIVANATSLPELIMPGITGFVFSSIEELRRLLERMSAGEIDLPQMSEAARSHAVTQFSYVPFGRNIILFYKQLYDRKA